MPVLQKSCNSLAVFDARGLDVLKLVSVERNLRPCSLRLSHRETAAIVRWQPVQHQVTLAEQRAGNPSALQNLRNEMFSLRYFRSALQVERRVNSNDSRGIFSMKG
jgi:hypothetical protein